MSKMQVGKLKKTLGTLFDKPNEHSKAALSPEQRKMAKARKEKDAREAKSQAEAAAAQKRAQVKVGQFLL